MSSDPAVVPGAPTTVRSVLVTGAASGIGRATALAAAAAGYAVGVGTFADDPYDAAAVVAQVRERGGRALAVEADVRDSAGMARAVDLVAATWGGLDAVVANAGVLHRAPLEELRDEDWQRIIDVDLTGVMRTVRAATPLLPRGGSVVLVSSIAGAALGWVGHTPYAAAKAGLIGFLRSAALELGPRGVRVNAVLPGVVESPQSLDPVNSGGAGGLVESARVVPLGRVGQPSDVADVIVFLLSDAARYVTAQALTVDGGLTAVWPG